MLVSILYKNNIDRAVIKLNCHEYEVSILYKNNIDQREEKIMTSKKSSVNPL